MGATTWAPTASARRLWPDHVGARSLSSPPQFAIRRDEGDLSIRGSIGDVNERVVAAAAGVHDADAVGKAGWGAFPSLALEDHGHGLGDPACGDGCAHLFHERTGRSWSVPPPAGGTGSDDVGCVNEKHRTGLIAPATWLPPWGCIFAANSNIARRRGLAANDDSC